DRDWEKELNLEVASGLSYRVTPKLWLGVEGRYHSVYPDWTDGLHRENYAIYAGPTVHYAAGEWSVTATWLPQLFGSPSRPGSSVIRWSSSQKRSTLASSSGASTSSRTQIGAGLVRKMAKISATAVSACSPPDSNVRVDSLLPGGCAMISSPASSGSSLSTSS